MLGKESSARKLIQALKNLSIMSCDLISKDPAFKKANNGVIVANADIKLPPDWKGVDVHIAQFAKHLITDYKASERITVIPSFHILQY